MHLSVLDLETQKTLREVGRDRIRDLKMSVAGVYDYPSDSYLTFEEDKLPDLERYLSQVDLLIGFNIKAFDLVVLEPYFADAVAHLPVLDLLEEIKRVRGHRVTLQSLAVGTLRQCKSGTGCDAVTLFREGKIEELKRYCLDDVRITREIFEYGRREGRVFFKSERDLKVHEVPVTWDARIHELGRKQDLFPLH